MVTVKRARKKYMVREPGAPVAASRFKAQCLELMDYVRETGREIVITKHGKPVAKLVPATVGAPDPFGYLRGTVTHMGDIVSPIDERWDAEES